MTICFLSYTIKDMDGQKEIYWGPKLWEELRSQQPERVCKRSIAEYDPAGFYELDSLDRKVRVYPQEERLETDDSDLFSSVDYQLLLVSYLLYAQNIEPIEDWVSEKDLKGGSLFFRGPHALPSAPMEKEFGSDPVGFRDEALTLGGSPLEFGDVSMVFPILPRISFAVVLWLKDEEFPARVTFMFDSSIDAHLPLDVIFAMTNAVTQKLLD